MIGVASDRRFGVHFVFVYHRPMWRWGLDGLARFSGFRPLAEA